MNIAPPSSPTPSQVKRRAPSPHLLTQEPTITQITLSDLPETIQTLLNHFE
ncbi:hypothetical protein [Nostoc sp.]|uniref:hypothetical protein n=1 Tax=Nostoc sp. TaxID=1180 RepID=UPI002FFA2294